VRVYLHRTDDMRHSFRHMEAVIGPRLSDDDWKHHSHGRLHLTFDLLQHRPCHTCFYFAVPLSCTCIALSPSLQTSRDLMFDTIIPWPRLSLFCYAPVRSPTYLTADCHPTWGNRKVRNAVTCRFQKITLKLGELGVNFLKSTCHCDTYFTISPGWMTVSWEVSRRAH